MRLSFKYVIKNVSDDNMSILKDLIWHTEKVMNTLLYDIKEESRKINFSGSLNILRKYIKESSPNQEYHLAMDKGREKRPIKKKVA